MRFRYIDSNGDEVSVEGAAELADLIRSGSVDEETLLYDHQGARWAPAREHDVFIAVDETRSYIDDYEDAAADDGYTTGDLSVETNRNDDEGAGGLTGETSRERPWLFRFNGQMLTCLAVWVLLLFFYPSTGSGRVPQLIGAFVASLAIPAVFLVWSAKTRSYIPLVAFILALVASLGWSVDQRERRADARKGIERLHVLVDELEAAGGPIHGLPGPAESRPATVEGRALWVADAVLRDMVTIADSIQRSFGAHLDPPGNWPNEYYLVNASRYPEVRAYFERYLAYADAVENDFDRLVDVRIRERLREAALSDAQAERWRRSFWEGQENNRDIRPQIAAAIRQLSTSSLELHDLLVHNAGTIHLSRDGIAVSERGGVNSEIDRLLDDIADAAARLESAQQRSVDVMRDALREGSEIFQ